ncbi:MAG: hypothetical protein U5J97_11635 [Trueperaceae bacterium]|nr:hypothetical protein [Trueperaceae bacterium]
MMATGTGTDGSITVSGTATTVTVTYTTVGIADTTAGTLIDTLAYRNTLDDPTAGARTITIASAKDDGGTSGTSQDTTSDIGIAATVTVVPVNDPVDAEATVEGTFTEGAAPLTFLTGTSVADLDADHFAGGSLTVALDAYRTGDVLSVASGAGGITVADSTISYDDGAGPDVIGTVTGGDGADLVMTFTTNDATGAAVAALLGQLTYASTSENPTFAGAYPDRTVTVTLDDGGNTGTGTGSASTDATPIAGTFAVVGVNDAPTLTGLDETAANSYVRGRYARRHRRERRRGRPGPRGPARGDGHARGELERRHARGPAAGDRQRRRPVRRRRQLGVRGRQRRARGDTIGTVSNAGGTLAITFDGSATSAAVDATLRAITYANGATHAGSARVRPRDARRDVR